AQVARLVNRTNVTPLGFYGLKRGVLGLGFWQGEPRPGLRDKLPSYMAHQGVVLPLLGVAEGEAEASGRLAFIHDAEEAIRRVDAQEYGIAIFLPPTPLPLLMQMADAGEHLPPKSTYFYPKAAAGLVCYSLTGTL
ncbi:MAG: DUF1015 family protein, partial [Chloroflexi bacterium]|nr:DUF1015 family protein [Chloroflexota bacterium]